MFTVGVQWASWPGVPGQRSHAEAVPRGRVACGRQGGCGVWFSALNGLRAHCARISVRFCLDHCHKPDTRSSPMCVLRASVMGDSACDWPQRHRRESDTMQLYRIYRAHGPVASSNVRDRLPTRECDAMGTRERRHAVMACWGSSIPLIAQRIQTIKLRGVRRLQVVQRLSDFRGPCGRCVAVCFSAPLLLHCTALHVYARISSAMHVNSTAAPPPATFNVFKVHSKPPPTPALYFSRTTGPTKTVTHSTLRLHTVACVCCLEHTINDSTYSTVYIA